MTADPHEVGPIASDTSQLCRDPTRIAAFSRYEIIDTPREAEYDDLVQLAAQVCHAPIAVVNFVLADRQWFKAEVGLGVRETPLELSICRHVLLSPGLTVIPDMREDPRLSCNPLVAEDTGLRFYAGHQLATPDGVPLGTLCILDRRPRTGLEPQQRFALGALARQLSSLLELRCALGEQRHLLQQKELLFDELNHRVANSLQMVASLMQLQSATSPGNREAQDMLADARNRVTTIAMLHEQLYRSGEVRTVELGGYLRGVVTSVAHTAAVHARFEAAGAVTLPTERAVPVALIVNELLANAVKHARPEPGALRVVVRMEARDDVVCSILVEDNGVGLPADFEPGRGRSLGMRIVLGLASQLAGKLTWTTGEGGACFRLDLPHAVHGGQQGLR